MSARHSVPRRSSGTAAPVVGFLLVAAFGVLFAGCSVPAIKGPGDVAPEDVTFTEDDIAALRAVQSSSASSLGADEAGSMQPGEGVPQLSLGSGSTVASAPMADPALVVSYDALRASATSGYKVINSFVNVRAEPRASAAFVQRLEESAPVSILEFVSADWAKADLGGGKIGYVASRYIAKVTSEEKLAEEKKAYEGLYFVDFAFVNVRKEPNQQTEKIGEIPGQSLVRPLSVNGEWARVSFEGREGFVTTQYLATFEPSFVVRQESFRLPILTYSAVAPGLMTAMRDQLKTLQSQGATLMTFREFRELLRAQQGRDVRLNPKSMIVAVTDVTAENVAAVTSALQEAGAKATLFMQTKNLGLSGITEKAVLDLVAAGYDLQSGAHSGGDLRTLTNAQVELELGQSKKMLEEMSKQEVFAVYYPGGGTNDRVAERARAAGYLFGIGNSPAPVFKRSAFLSLPSYTVSATMNVEELATLFQ